MLFDSDALVRWLEARRYDYNHRHFYYPDLHLDIRASEISSILLAIENGQFKMNAPSEFLPGFEWET